MIFALTGRYEVCFDQQTVSDCWCLL